MDKRNTRERPTLFATEPPFVYESGAHCAALGHSFQVISFSDQHTRAPGVGGPGFAIAFVSPML